MDAPNHEVQEGDTGAETMDARRFFNVMAMGYDWITDQGFWREQIGQVLDLVPPECRESQIRRVLDIGCGPGVSTFVLARQLPEADIEGVDISEKMVARAQRHLQQLRAKGERLDNVRLWQGDGAALGGAGERYDLVVGHSFLYLVADRAALLAELFRALAPGGTLVLLEPCEASRPSRAMVQALGERLQGLSRAPEELRSGLDAWARFGISMFAWRVVSRRVGQFAPPKLEALLREASFEEVATHLTLGGLGVHAVGRKPLAPVVAAPGKSPRKRTGGHRKTVNPSATLVIEDEHVR